jgi:hypothetical protein
MSQVFAPFFMVGIYTFFFGLLFTWVVGACYYLIQKKPVPWRRQIVVVVTLSLLFTLTAISLFYEWKTDKQPDVQEETKKWAAKRYWKSVTEKYPKLIPSDDEKYITCTPRFSGFNNERMVLELAFAFAYTLNRTLVLNAPFWVDHLGNTNKDLSDFFDFNDLAKGVKTISYSEFVQRMGFQNAPYDMGRLDQFFQNKEFETSGLVYRLPEKYRTNLDWVFAWPKIPPKDTDDYRLLEAFAGPFRRNFYDVNTDPQMLSAKIIHFETRTLFGHFYNAIYFSDFALYQTLLWKVKNFIHFREEFFVKAERIINRLGPSYAALHVRRGDFQYPHQRNIPYTTIYQNIYNLLKPNETLYLATDETDMAKFEREELPILKQRYNVRMFREFKHLIEEDTPEYMFGVIETLVCSYARIFIGTKLSTFSGYIHRLRGYYPDTVNPSIYFTDTKYLGELPYNWGRAPMVNGCGTEVGGNCYVWCWEFEEAWRYAQNPHFLDA